MQHIPISQKQLADFCQRWQIVELAVFGSVTRSDFGPESDIDVLVRFADDAHWGLFAYVAMQQELESLCERRVDLISRRGIEASRNRVRSEAILSSAQVLYAS